MARQFVIGIDIGTSGCKSLLIDDRDRGLYSSLKSTVGQISEIC